MPASGVLFAGNSIKLLKDQLRLRDTARIITGTQDPRVVATDAETGSLLLQQGSGGKLFLKNDNGLTTNWTLLTAGVSEEALEILETLKNHLSNSSYAFVTPSIIGMVEDDLVGTFGGTAALDIPNEALSFPAISDSITSVNLLDKENFIEDADRLQDVTKSIISLFWNPNAIDSGATVEASRDGGATWKTVEMERVGAATEVFAGEVSWTSEEEQLFNNGFLTDDTSTPLTDTAGTTEAGAQLHNFSFGFGVDVRVRSILVKLSRLGTITGNYRIKILNENAGAPGSSVLYTSEWKSAAAVPTIATFIQFDLNNFYLPDNTNYYISVETDDAYKASYTGGNNLRWHRSNASGTGAYTLDGSTWTIVSTAQFNYQINTAVEKFASLLSDIAATTSNTAINTTTARQIAREIIVPNGEAKVVKRASLRLLRTGTLSGNISYKIVRDNGSGLPSTAQGDILSVSEVIAASSINTSEQLVTLDMSRVVLGPGTYHLVVLGDDSYYSSFSSGINEISVRSFSGASINGFGTFNGTTWSEGSATQHIIYELIGRILDLRIRVTSSAINRLLTAFAAFYSPELEVAQGVIKSDIKSFLSATDNLNEFDINFLPDPTLLEVYHVETGQVYKYPKFRISGSTISFDANTFLAYPDTTVTLKFIQAKGTSFDNSDQNANAIAKLEQNVIDIGEELLESSPFVSLPKITVPYNTITNRAKMADLSKDLRPRMGIERFMFTDIVRCFDEVGPSGLPVWKMVNDRYDQLRLIGDVNYGLSNDGGTAGLYGAMSYMEFSFYGTGLNVLVLTDTTDRSILVSVDGGTATTVANTGTALYGTQGYNGNGILRVASGLSQGLHTVKIQRNVNNAFFYGFEIINTHTTASNIVIPGGDYYYKGKKRSSVTTTLPYNSGFESQIGTNHGRGGTVVIYQKADGTIKHAVRWAPAASSTYTLASHTSETLVEERFWREFGTARSDDYSLLAASAGAKGFVSDDNTTSLCSTNAIREMQAGSPVGTISRDTLCNSGDSNFHVFNFVGTGLDLDIGGFPGSGDDYSIILDNVNLGSIPSLSQSDGTIYKVASGLAHGAHTVKILRTSGASVNLGIARFLVYANKKPDIPVDAVELGSYNIMANVVGNTSAGQLTISQGVIRKSAMREFRFNGTVTRVAISSASASESWHGIRYDLSTSGGWFEIEFWGTGFEIRGEANAAYSNTSTVSLNGTTLTATSFPTASFAQYGGYTFTPGTGNLSWNDGTAVGAGFRTTGLPLGVYRLRVTNGTSNNMRIYGVDIFTPVHSYKIEKTGFANNYSRVSESIADSRQFAKKYKKQNIIRTGAYNSGPSISAPSAPVPLDSMHTVIQTTGKPIEVTAKAMVQNTTGANIYFYIYVNGVRFDETDWFEELQTSIKTMLNERAIIPLPAGQHHIAVYWRNTLGTTTAEARMRKMYIRELEQEA